MKLFSKTKFLILSLIFSVLYSGLSLAQSIDKQRNKLPEIGVVASDTLTIEKEKVVGDVIMRQLRGQAPLVHDPVLNEYIQGIGNKLVIHADNAKFPFKFFMINNSAINAFAFYGGHIGIHTGLLAQANTESELASVFAHEVAHVTQRHLARRAQSQERSFPLQIASLLGGILLAIADPEAGMAAIYASQAASAQSTINFTRKNEQEADNIGINILYRAGFDPMGAPAFFEKLLAAASNTSSANQLAFLRTHPLPSDRVAETVTRARSYGNRSLAASLDFQLAKARIKARYMSTPKRNIEYFASIQNRSNVGVYNLAADYGLAISYFENEEYSKANIIMQDLLNFSPENLFFLDLMTDVLIEQEKAKSAVSLLLPLWTLKPKNNVLALNLANAYIAAQNYEPAIEILRDLLLIDRENFLAYQLLHDAYNRTLNKKDAHMVQAEIYALIAAYPLAIDELQFAYNQTNNDNIEKQRIKGRIAQFREAQINMMSLSI